MTSAPASVGGRCIFEDGSQYTGQWEDGMAQGYGICNGPPHLQPQQYAGQWHYGFESSGVFCWDGDSNSYEGQWQQGKCHGVGVERRGHWVYKGEWNQGFKGRYGVRQSTLSGMKYEGTWNVGLLDGYGIETYPDGGTYQGQYMRGVRHGYGVRQSVPYALAIRSQVDVFNCVTNTLPPNSSNTLSTSNMVRARDQRMEECKGGFVLMSRLTPDDQKRKRLILDKQGRPSIRKTIANEFRLIRQRSVGESLGSDHVGETRSSNHTRPSSVSGSVRSTTSQLSQLSQKTSPSMYSQDDDGGSFISNREDDVILDDVTERYLGEWKSDKRTGYGVGERSDGLKYEGEWLNNRRHGYGVTTLPDGRRFEGKFKNNIFIDANASTTKIFALRPGKIKDRVDAAVNAAHRAAVLALEKQGTASERMLSARQKVQETEEIAKKASLDADTAKKIVSNFSPNQLLDVPLLANRPHLDPTFLSRTLDPLQSPNKKFTFFKPRKLDPPTMYPSTTTYVTINPMPSLPLSSNLNNSYLEGKPTQADYRRSDNRGGAPLSGRAGLLNISGAPLDGRGLTGGGAPSNYKGVGGDSRAGNVGIPGGNTLGNIGGNTAGKGVTINTRGVFPDVKTATLKVPQQEFTVTTNSGASILKGSRDYMPPTSQPPTYPTKEGQNSSRPGVSFTSIESQSPSILYSVSEPIKYQDNFTYVEPNKVLGLRGAQAQKLGQGADSLFSPQNRVLSGSKKSQLGAYQVENRPQQEMFQFNSISPPTNQPHQHNQTPYQAQSNHLPPSPSLSPDSYDSPRYSPSANLEGKYGRCYGDAYGTDAPADPFSSDRRKSLPAIVKQMGGAVVSSEGGLTPVGEETFIIEDGVRRRRVRPSDEMEEAKKIGTATAGSVVKATAALASSTFYSVEPPKQNYKQGDRGSVPNVAGVGKEEVLPREVVYVMSQKRREELIVERAEREKRQMQNIVLRFGDLMGWFSSHQLFLIILLFNVALFIVFYHVLRQE